MLKHYLISTIGWLAVMALVLVPDTVPNWPFALVIAVCVSIMIWGAAKVSSNFYFDVRCKAATKEKIVALSFDDGPLENYTPQILEILQQHKVPAAFFCIGDRVEKAPGLLKEIHNAGHLVGNHSYAHGALFDLQSAGNMKKDLDKADKTIIAAIGFKPRLFRPPYGVTNPMLAKAVKQGGYTPVGWSIRSMDTVIKNEEELLAKVTKNVQPGDIFLFHDTCAVTVKILPALIKQLKEQGFAFKRIDELLNVPAYA